ncbi:glycine cleavage T C-terminal barrel domain-containing protein [Fodinicurvata halophila]|uniref:glycine cleavage T C-terminal barrel domain-containing protein n=1 Tax=Fodinicurvata halophila TaxID=1419723 RepID=UPI003625BC55
MEDGPKGARSLGFVTSSYWSPTLERPIALALIASGRQRQGRTSISTISETGDGPP